jgi:hypothetical protein
LRLYAYTNGNPISYRDPDGTDPVLAAIGALGGFGFGYISGLIEGQSGHELLVHALEDAAFGGLTGLTDGLNLAGALTVNVGINAAGEAYKEGIDQLATGCGKFNGTKIAFAGLGGLVGDLGGKLAGSALSSARTELTHVFQESSPILEAIIGTNISGAISLTPAIITRANAP